jgi:ABC-2 type transport system ATP-binding protein
MKIALQKISKSYSNKQLFNNLSFEIDKGSIVTITGKNASGKSTLLKIIVGLVNQDSGYVEYADMEETVPYETAKKLIGYAGTSELLIEGLTGIDYFNFIRAIYRIPKSEFENRLFDLFSRFNIQPELFYQPITTYSTGYRKITEIFSALLHNPDIIVLDEPFNGLDSDFTHILVDCLVGLKTADKTIIIATHDNYFVNSYSDKTVNI